MVLEIRNIIFVLEFKIVRYIMALSDKIPYKPLDRPKLKLPNGKRMAVWVCVNIEEWRIEGPMPRMVLSLRWVSHCPDTKLSWHEYGMRAGV